MRHLFKNFSKFIDKKLAKLRFFLLLLTDRVEEFILGDLRHQSVDEFNRSAAAIASRLREFVFVALVTSLGGHEVSSAQARLALFEFLRQVEDLTGGVLGVAEQARTSQRVDPVLVPQRVQELAVQGGFEVSDVELIVLLAVDTKVLDFVQRNRLVLGWFFVWRLVALRVRSESSEIDFS